MRASLLMGMPILSRGAAEERPGRRKERAATTGRCGAEAAEMTDEDQRVRAVVDSLAESLSCDRDGTRLRYGDYEWRRCGADVEDVLSEWARRLVRRLEGPGG